MKKIDTYLPVFPGFYNTIFESDESDVIYRINNDRGAKKLQPLKFDQIEFDYENYENEVAKDCCSFIEYELNRLNFITSIHFQSISSPREYNFSNDSINISVELSEDNIKRIKQYLFENIKAFKDYIEKRYTSCSGFISSYSNDHTEWLAEIDEALFHSHKLGSILNFICEMHDFDINEEQMKNACDCTLSVLNFVEVYDMEYCNTCNSFVEPADFVGNTCKDCFEFDKVNLNVIVCSHCRELITNEHEKRHFQVQINLKNIKYSEVLCSECNI